MKELKHLRVTSLIFLEVLLNNTNYAQTFAEWHRVKDLNQGVIIDAVSGDFNKDGWLDFAIADYDSIAVYYNNQSTHFEFTPISVPGLSGISYIELSDVNQDGTEELVVLKGQHIYEVSGLKEGLLETKKVGVIEGQFFGKTFEINDLDGDQQPELIAYGYDIKYNENLSFYHYPSLSEYCSPYYGYSFRAGCGWNPLSLLFSLDIDNDDRLEFVGKKLINCVSTNQNDFYSDEESWVVKINQDFTFSESKILGEYKSFASAVDVNNDGYVDLVGYSQILAINDTQGGWISVTCEFGLASSDLTRWADLDGNSNLEEVIEYYNGFRIVSTSYDPVNKSLNILNTQEITGQRNFPGRKSAQDFQDDQVEYRANRSILIGDFNNDGITDIINNSNYFDISAFSETSVPSDTTDRVIDMDVFYSDARIISDTLVLPEIVLLQHDTTISIDAKNTGTKLIAINYSNESNVNNGAGLSWQYGKKFLRPSETTRVNLELKKTK